MNKDLAFIAGNYLEVEIPKDKKFLTKYFDTEIQKALLRYWLATGSVENFTDHTGVYLSPVVAKRWESRIFQLLEVQSALRKQFTEEAMEKLRLLEAGELPLTQLP